jgi:preprotein translocase subunit SecA
VTISTNMAGRGVDIRLGEGVDDLGGLHVIGTNRHESRRIDHQLRGRAGRQGDPGSSRFFVSREDPLLMKFSEGDPAMSPDQCQRVAEGENLEIRQFLHRYESVIEAQRRSIAERRQALVEDGVGLEGPEAARGRLVRLAVIDELWSDYLAAVAELRSGSAWISLGYGDPLGHFLRQVHAMFGEMEQSIEAEVEARLVDIEHGADPPRRGATWTYLTHDAPFGGMTQRIIRELERRHRAKKARRRGDQAVH